MKQSFLISMTLLLSVFSASFTAANDSGYPLRKSFPGVAIIDTETLQRRFGRVTIVDVRSQFEYDTIHILGAKLAPISLRQFDVSLLRISRGNRRIPLVFYCNGHSCNKSYLAAQHAKLKGYQKVWAYDGGISEWSKAHPERTALLGTTPILATQLIPLAQHQTQLLPHRSFVKDCVGPNKVVFDIRDPIQRKDHAYLDGIAQKYPIDRLIHLLGTQRFQQKHDKETFCFFDAVGKQVRWLQYYLESHNYTNYHFLKGGVNSTH